MSDVLVEATAWLAEDPDPETRTELRELIGTAQRGDQADQGAAALAEIGDRFSAFLAFGTAGLRGALGAGPNRMNRVVVQRAAAGLAAYLAARGGTSVVVGFDARHKSDQFARDSADVLAGAGLRALMLPGPLPTPVLAFAVRHLGCDAGVMVTASHNPARDNGYKVYLGDGAQIAPPTDAEIAAHIEAVGPLASLARSSAWDTLDDGVLDAYLDRVAALVRGGPSASRDLRTVYTPLHGVGRDVLVAAFSRAGFPAPSVVAEQAEPDPDFPTVPFPNPEEFGALDLALAAGRRENADLVLANDPDADRCAVAVGERLLSGDEVGALLGVHLLRRDPSRAGTYAASIVSSSLLGEIAERHGIRYETTLTGFKWIARVPGLRYGYEEALGYCVDPDAVRDKDGIAAALLLAELAAALKAQRRTLLDLLDDLARDYGVHATSQLSVRLDDLAGIDAAMTRLRTTPPALLGGLSVASAEDLSLGVDGLPATNGMRYQLAQEARVVVRPSGTEPKLKAYLEVVVPVGAQGEPAAARAQAADRLTRIGGDLTTALGIT